MAKKSGKQTGLALDYSTARYVLNQRFASIESAHAAGSEAPTCSAHETIDRIFSSETQAYREALLGCALARLQNKEIDIRLPYSKHGTNAFSGRTLDENVVNPFLKDNRIPSSKAPYLSTFRRGVKFIPETRVGLRDLEGYDAFLSCISVLCAMDDDNDILNVIDYILYRFLILREQSNVPVAHIRRLSVPQYNRLIDSLLNVQSGGRVPMFLAVAMFRTIKHVYSLDWKIDFQGINVADASSNASGDIAISIGDKILMAAEVTERLVSRDRVVSTFTAKIAESGIPDYLFFAAPDEQSKATEQAERYFAQGHEINFVNLADWLHHSLVTVGTAGRDIFNEHLVELLQREETPTSLKVAWNTIISEIASN